MTYILEYENGLIVTLRSNKKLTELKVKSSEGLRSICTRLEKNESTNSL